MATCYRAKHTSANKWLQRLDWDPQATQAAFKTHVAAQFAISESDITVVVTDWTATQRDTATAELTAGNHEGLPVIAATPAPRLAAGREFLKNGLLPNITGANNAAKRTRLATVMAADRGLSNFFSLCNQFETLAGADYVFSRNLWATKLSEAAGGLTAAEVGAIEAAAPTYGFTLP